MISKFINGCPECLASNSNEIVYLGYSVADLVPEFFQLPLQPIFHLLSNMILLLRRTSKVAELNIECCLAHFPVKLSVLGCLDRLVGGVDPPHSRFFLSAM